MPGLSETERYACYYGRGRLQELAQFPLVILQPSAYTPDELGALHEGGTQVLAYLSIGEDDPHAPPAPWHIRTETGRRRRNPVWHSLYVDVGHPGWQDRVLSQVAPALLQTGRFDGLFLDTLDSAALMPASRQGAIALVHELRSVFPGAILWANRGFQLLESVAVDLDGVVAEAFSTYYRDGEYRMWQSPQRELNASVAAWLAELRSRFGLALLALDYASPGDLAMREFAERRARAHGMIPYVTTWDLQMLSLPTDGPSCPAGGL